MNIGITFIRLKQTLLQRDDSFALCLLDVEVYQLSANTSIKWDGGRCVSVSLFDVSPSGGQKFFKVDFTIVVSYVGILLRISN